MSGGPGALERYMDATTAMVLANLAETSSVEDRLAMATALLETAGKVMLSCRPPNVAAQVMYLHADAMATRAAAP